MPGEVFSLPVTALMADLITRSRPAGYAVQVGRSVTNYCDLDTYPTLEELEAVTESGCAVCVGIHPKHATNIQEQDFERFAALIAHPSVVGVGEVGLDHTKEVSVWAHQHYLLDRVLHVLQDHQVLVLHCRSPVGSDEAYYPLLYHLKGRINPSQLIHCHCFTGSLAVYQDWMAIFPNSFFGFTKIVSGFDAEQMDALRAVPDDRILLETDAPYFKWPGHRFSNPSYIGKVANVVAQAREVSWEHILALSVANVHSLYGTGSQ